MWKWVFYSYVTACGLQGYIEDVFTNTSLRDTEPRLSTPTLTFAQRHLVYNIIDGVMGIAAVIFNSIIFVLLTKKPALKHHVSIMLLQLFIFCFIHGIVMGIIRPIQNVFCHEMPTSICVINSLTMSFLDNYFLALMPLLSIERLIAVKKPLLNPNSMKAWTVGMTGFAIVFTAIYTWLPLLAGSFGNPRLTDDYSMKLDRGCTCNGHIADIPHVQSVLILIVQLVSVTVVIGAYICMYRIARARLRRFSAHPRRRLSKAALSVMLIITLFLITSLPYGVVVQIRSLCHAGVETVSPHLCDGVTSELQHGFNALAHLSSGLAPLLFSCLNPRIYMTMRAFLLCSKQNEINFTSKRNQHTPNIPVILLHHAPSTASTTPSESTQEWETS